jgi:hypothetical protein
MCTHPQCALCSRHFRICAATLHAYTTAAALYVNKLRVAGLLTAPVDGHFERLFETGVDEMSWDDLSIGGQQWPSVASVHAYRYTSIRRFFSKAVITVLISPIFPFKKNKRINLGFQRSSVECYSIRRTVFEGSLDVVRGRVCSWWPMPLRRGCNVFVSAELGVFGSCGE